MVVIDREAESYWDFMTRINKTEGMSTFYKNTAVEALRGTINNKTFKRKAINKAIRNKLNVIFRNMENESPA